MLKDEEIKKGAGYLEELAGRLRRERIHTLPVQDGLLTVTLDDRPVGAVAENGDMYQRRSDLDTPEAKNLYFRVLDISREVAEYRNEMERAPILDAEGVNEPYKLLAEYKDVILCRCQYENGYGVRSDGKPEPFFSGVVGGDLPKRPADALHRSGTDVVTGKVLCRRCKT